MKANWFKFTQLATIAMLVASTGFAVEGAKKSTSAGTTAGVLVAEASNVTSDAGSTVTSVPVETDQKYLLGIDIRPSYYPTAFNATPGTLGGDKFGIEYTAWAGIQFNKNNSFIYEQYINTVGNNPNATMNLEPKMMEGAARVQFNNIWTSEKLGLALSYENRTLLPWRRDLRDRNRVLANRNYLKLKKTFNENFSLTLMEVPIVFVHTTPNALTSAGTLKNNEAFENRVTSFRPERLWTVNSPPACRCGSQAPRVVMSLRSRTNSLRGRKWTTRSTKISRSAWRSSPETW